MSIYITGDTHGGFDRIEEFCRTNNTTKYDTIVILGDAGINYFEDFRDDDLKKKLSKLPITLFCVHGNHEQRPYMIPTYREKEWRGGSVYMEESYPNLLFAKDGELFDLDGMKVLVIGGAYSVDKYIRVLRGMKWFKQEQPSDEIKQYVEKQLESANWTVDLVLSHTCPRKYEPVEVFLDGINQTSVDHTTEDWLDDLENAMSYQKWYCGHFHTEKIIDKMEFMFRSTHELTLE